MTTFQVAELTDGKRFSDRLILDKQFVVLDSNLSFSSALQSRLVEWGFKEVFCKSNTAVEKKAAAPNMSETVEINLDELNEEFETKSTALNATLKSVIAKVNQAIKFTPDKNRMENVTEVYNEYIKYTQAVFTRYVTQTELRLDELSESVRLLIDFIKINKK